MAEPLRDRGCDRAPQLHFDYRSLDSETLQYVWKRAGIIHSLAWQTASGVVDIGQALSEVKERLGHGQFLLWVTDEFAWGHDWATRFMNVYERFKLSNLNNLEIDLSALYLIAEQKIPDAVRDELIQRAESGEKITRRVALKAIEQFKEAGSRTHVYRSGSISRTQPSYTRACRCITWSARSGTGVSAQSMSA